MIRLSRVCDFCQVMISKNCDWSNSSMGEEGWMALSNSQYMGDRLDKQITIDICPECVEKQKQKRGPIK